MTEKFNDKTFTGHVGPLRYIQIDAY